MPNRILILFAHPLFERSRTNQILRDYIPEDERITFHDLYETYPDFNIQIEEEKALLLDHDLIVWHHPFYWYSCPPLLKQWIDMVLEVGWAYGPGGRALKGKKILQVISSGGGKSAYQPEGHNRFTMRQYLVPFEQTAVLCHMGYLPPFLIQGTHRLSLEEIHRYGQSYAYLLNLLATQDLNAAPWGDAEYMNDYLQNKAVL